MYIEMLTIFADPPCLSQMSVPTDLSDVTCLSHRRISAEPLQRADQLSGGRRRRQLRRRLSVPPGRAEDRPAHAGRTAHAQRPRHGAGRPRHGGRLQDGPPVSERAAVAAAWTHTLWPHRPHRKLKIYI